MCRARRGEDGAPGSMPVAAAGREILPANVKPLHYDLTLEPNFEDFSFKGTVHIEYASLFSLISAVYLRIAN